MAEKKFPWQEYFLLLKSISIFFDLVAAIVCLILLLKNKALPPVIFAYLWSLFQKKSIKTGLPFAPI